MARNNEDRIGISDRNAGAEAPVNPQMPPHMKQERSALNFVSPTEFVELPSGGKLYPPNHALHNVDAIEIRYMTTKEEDILTSETLIKQGKAINRLLQQVIVNQNIDINSILIGDKNAILVAVRKSGYGSEYQTQATCPSCLEKSEYEFNLNNVLINKGIEDSRDLNDKVYKTENNTFIIKELPVTKWSVEVRALDGTDEKALLSISETRRKRKLPEDTLTSQMLAFIVSISGVSDKREVATAISSMPAKDAREIRAIYQKIIPNVDMTQTFTCELCSYSGNVEVPFTTDFFWPK